MTPKEINLFVENNRLRRGLVMAEAELTRIVENAKPSDRAPDTIAIIRNALRGGNTDEDRADYEKQSAT
jgi:hypothetical protein